MRRGQTLRGSELLSAAQFNRLKRGDGVGFSTRDTVSVPSLLLGRSGREVLRVARQEESSHFLLMGDTGTGKSSLIRQLLEQIADRGEAAIVYDPALEFTPQFYEPERGDQILNPLDTRMPYWSPGDEVQHKAEALAFAKSLFPDDRRDNRFFIEAPRRVFARLLSFKPTAADIAQWLQNPADIDRRLAGTELASMIDASAPSQRAGVLASLSMVGEAFQLIPDRAETKGTWSAYEWAQHRKGWLFLTSTPQTLDRLRPLISVWFDLLLMRLLELDLWRRRGAGRALRRDGPESEHGPPAVVVELGAHQSELLEHGAARRGGTLLLLRAVARSRTSVASAEMNAWPSSFSCEASTSAVTAPSVPLRSLHNRRTSTR